jgi:6-phosphogluconate dehydrogenase
MKQTIGIIGLGKMGTGLAKNLLRKGYHVVGYNRTTEVARTLETVGLQVALNIEELIDTLQTPKIIWVMLPAGEVTQMVVTHLSELLTKEDVVINGANSFYKDSICYYEELKRKEINYIDLGFSGGPKGAEFAPCFMIGNQEVSKKLDNLWVDLVTGSSGGFEYFDQPGAGHFVKMVHNGMEYGMMQSISEGVEVLLKSHLEIDIVKAVSSFTKGSIIDSKLMRVLHSELENTKHLENISTKVEQSGEGLWTSNEAKQLSVSTPALNAAIHTRLVSFLKSSYQNQITNLIRHGFGGHDISLPTSQINTKLFLDSGNPGETAKAKFLLGFLDGQTTNPSLIKNNPMVSHDTITGSVCTPDQLDKLYKGIVDQVNAIDDSLDLSVEIFVDETTSVETILREARKVAGWAPNIRIKIPVIMNGLIAGKILCEEGIRLNFTLVFTQEQVAAVHNAVQHTIYPVFVSPFIGRLNDIGLHGLDLVTNCRRMLGESNTVIQILAASVRTVEDLTKLFGVADVITAPLGVYQSWMNQEKIIVEVSEFTPIPYKELSMKEDFSTMDITHELTQKGLNKFVDDWNAIRCL